MGADLNDCDYPRSLRSDGCIKFRKLMLHEPHIAPLTAYVAELRRLQPELEFPEFDPFDGGVAARILFLFEKPGPMTSGKGKGSGFISRNNDDATAAATYKFMSDANIPRRSTITWNVIPGWNGTIKVTPAELRSGVQAVMDLLKILPNVNTVVLVGKKAQRAKPLLTDLKLRVLVSAHPSPKVRATSPEKWQAISSEWSEALLT